VGGFRTGLLIGVLGTAVVALGIVVFVLITDDEGSSSEGATKETIVGMPERCLIEHSPEGESFQAELDLRSSELTCSTARDIFYALQARDAVEYPGGFNEPVREQGWACYFHPLAEHPLMEHCSAPGRRFLVLSLKPAAHSGGAPSPPLPPRGTQVECGDLGDDGYGTYNVNGNGVDCDTARRMAYIWEGVCSGIDMGPNPCPIIDGFSCTQSKVGIELVSIACVKPGRAVTFENGA
jgi:hypothetical protein